MKKSLVFAVVIFFCCSLYLLTPPINFPLPPTGSLVSKEPADTESKYRRAYYTNLSREQVISHYKNQFPNSIRVDQPPEFAYELVRDQTRSSWLEELVRPWKESLYINGFYPTKPTEQINIDGVHYINKITVRLIPSSPITRITTLVLTVLSSAWLLKEIKNV